MLGEDLRVSGTEYFNFSDKEELPPFLWNIMMLEGLNKSFSKSQVQEWDRHDSNLQDLGFPQVLSFGTIHAYLVLVGFKSEDQSDKNLGKVWEMRKSVPGLTHILD